MEKSEIIAGIALFLICGVVLLFGGCGKREEASARAVASGHVDVIRLEGGDWGYPTPYAHYPRGPGGFKMCLIFDSLLERDGKGVIPWLAEGYEVLENGRQYLFTIRKGVTWHDGKPLTADDVRFSLEYASRHPMTWSYVYHAIGKVEVLDDQKVLVTVSRPDAAMLYKLGRTRIIPRHIWEKVEWPKEFTAPRAVIGCGPYRLTGYSKEHGTYRFDAYEAYWGPGQRVRRIEFIPVSEPILAFEKGDIHLTRIPADVLPRFQRDGRYKVVKSPGFWGYRLLFNMERGSALEKREVRRAIRFAVDPDELVSKIARGAAVPGSAGILPRDHVMYNSRLKQYPHDLKRAGDLLSAAGYGAVNSHGIRVNASGEPLSFTVLCAVREVRMVELLKERLSEAGIEIRILSVDGKTRDVRVREHSYQMAVIGHGGWGGDPDYLRLRFAGNLTATDSPSASGVPGYDNDELNALLEQQHGEMDMEKRKKTVFRIQEILAGDVPEIPLFMTTDYTVYRPETYDGWEFMFDHHYLSHSKLSYLEKQIMDQT